MEFKEGKRVDLCYEGIATGDGRFLELGALDFWDEDYVPVTARDGRGLNEVIGRASAFERKEGSGQNLISAVIELTEHCLVEADQTNRHIEVTNLQGEERDGLFVVTKGTLRAVFLSNGQGGWPALDVVHPAEPEHPVAYGVADVTHMENPVVLDLDDEALEWLTNAAADFSEDVRAMMQAAYEARKAR